MATKITNLTNSTWFFNNSLIGFDETITINVNFTSNDFEYEQILYELGTGLIFIKDNVPTTVYPIIDGVGSWVNEESRTILITGGEDVANEDIINTLKGLATYVSGGTVEEEIPEVIAYKASVSGLGNEDPSTATFTLEKNFPTSFEEVTDDLGNIFIKIPTMYRKVDSVVDGQITGFTIATGKIDDSYAPYPVFVKPDGTVMPYVLIGKYTNESNESMISQETPENSVEYTLDEARYKSQNLGTGYQQYDWQFQKLFIDLCLVVSQKVDFQNGDALVNSFLGVERLSQYIWVDGIVKDGNIWRVCYNPDEYVSNATSSTNNYVAVSYTAPTEDGDIKKLGFDENNPFVNYVNEIIIGENTTYYCDDYWYGDENFNNVSTYVGFNNKGSGLWQTATSSNLEGVNVARLCYRPIAEEEEEPDTPTDPEEPEIPDNLEVIDYTASVSGLGNEDPSSLVFTKSVNFPSRFSEVTDEYENVFIKIPTMYRKIEKAENEQITSFRMSTVKIDDTYEPYSVFVKPDGSVMEFVLIGKYYNSSSDGMVSKNASTGSILEIGNARTYAQKLGAGYQQYDWQFHKLIQDLILLNSQKVNFADGEKVTSYLGIENLNHKYWVDGVAVRQKEQYYFVCDDPTKYEISGLYPELDGDYHIPTYKMPAKNTQGCIKKLGYSATFYPFFNYPSEIVEDTTYSKYYCDSFYEYTETDSSDFAYLTSTIGNSNSVYGIWDTNISYTTYSAYSRLCYRPIERQGIEEPDVPDEPEDSETVRLKSAKVTNLGSEDDSKVTFMRGAEFPTTFEEITDEKGNVFIKIPRMYRKVNTSADYQITSFSMSLYQLDSDYEPYPVFIKPDGTLMDYVLIGKYLNSSSSDIVSVESDSTTEMVLGDARTYARSLGTGYQLYDWQFQRLLQDLFLVMSKTVDFQNGDAEITEYLGIKNINKTCFVDGIARKGTAWLFSYNPEKYVSYPAVDINEYVEAGYLAPTSNNLIKKIGFKDGPHRFFNYPSDTTSPDAYVSSYYCDYYEYLSGDHPVASNVGGIENINGIWHCNTKIKWTDASGVRLCYRPIAEEVEEPEEPDAEYKTLNSLLSGIAAAIRTKKGTIALINAQDFPKEIRSITADAEGDYDGTIEVV